MTVVVDASTVVAALLDTGPVGRWAESVIAAGALAAPHFMPVEVANILRRSVLAKNVSGEIGARAHRNVLDLRVELFPYEPFATRVWELRANITAYDAWYVAVAETFDAQLATLDRALVRASGPRCDFATP